MDDGFKVCSYRCDYDVEFIEDAVKRIEEVLCLGDRIVADRNVCGLYPALVEVVARFDPILITPTEQIKSYEGIAPVIGQLIEDGFTRNNRLIAIGGGIVQDVTAFTASILLRGVDWLFFPTNLLSQCDSCIGSKTSINFRDYKNQLGGFYPPKAVYIDVGFLNTLPDLEIHSGLGEMMHYFLVSGEDDFRWGSERIDRALAERSVLREMIGRSLTIKKSMIEKDEFDEGPRSVFNYGHSFGHALESATGYAVPHGIAVSYGMDLANIISARQGLVPMSFRNRIRPALESIWQNTPLEPIPIDAYLSALAKDKKNEGHNIKVILTSGFGQMFKTTLQLSDSARNIIEAFFEDKLYERAL